MNSDFPNTRPLPVTDIVEMLGWAGPWPVAPVVVDTNVLLNSLYRGVLKNADMIWLLAARAGFVRFFAPDHVFEEMEEKVAHGSDWMVRRRITDIQPYRERWEKEYLSLIRFVTIDPAVVDDPRIGQLRARDPDDPPFAALALLVAPCLAFSEDRDIADYGLATVDWQPVAELAGEAANAGQAMLSTTWASEITVRLTASGVKKLARSDWWPLVALAVLFGLAILHQHRPITRGQLRIWVDNTMRFLEPAFNAFGELMVRGQAIFERLQAAAIPGLEPTPALHQLARLVATSPRPLTGTALTEQIRALGVSTNRTRVLAALRQYPFFVPDERQHWRLGRLLGPRD